MPVDPRYLKSHDTREGAEVPDGGVGHGQVVGRHRVFTTTVTIQASAWGGERNNVFSLHVFHNNETHRHNAVRNANSRGPWRELHVPDALTVWTLNAITQLLLQKRFTESSLFLLSTILTSEWLVRHMVHGLDIFLF